MYYTIFVVLSSAGAAERRRHSSRGAAPRVLKQRRQGALHRTELIV